VWEWRHRPPIQRPSDERPTAAAPYNDLAADSNKMDILVKHVLELFNSTRLTAQEAKEVLTHLQVLAQIGERVAHRKKDH